MKVVGFIGSPRRGGHTDTLVRQVLAGAARQGAQTEVVYLNDLQLKGCQACMYCRGHEGCAVKDDMQPLYTAIASADAVVIGSPVFMYQLSGQTKIFIDRLFPYLKLPEPISKVHKPSVLVLSQGNPDATAWEAGWEISRQALTLLGFPVRETIIAGQALDKSSAASQVNVMEQAEQAGARLAGDSKAKRGLTAVPGSSN